LADLYPYSNHVYLLGLAEADDEEVWELARREGYLIVTKDADFSDLCMLFGFPPKVIWIRRGNCETKAIESVLRRHIEEIRALDANEIIGVLALY
jgi:predicted nuclease of predicted toxin-antitoxin system